MRRAAAAQSGAPRIPRRRTWLAAPCLLWLAGCAQPPRAPTTQQEDSWSGRIALQLHDGQSGQSSGQSFSAQFELHGNAQSGALALLGPMGNRVAQLDWSDGHARLQSSGQTRSSESLDALLQDLTGAPIPIAALFGWLKGIHATATGWQADLSEIAKGRLSARRDAPAPQAVLRIILDR